MKEQGKANKDKGEIIEEGEREKREEKRGEIGDTGGREIRGNMNGRGYLKWCQKVSVSGRQLKMILILV